MRSPVGPLLALALFSLASAEIVHELLSSLTNIPDSVKNKLEDLGLTAANLNRCQFACSSLSILLAGDYTAVDKPGYTPLPFWSIQQSEVVPACRIDASSAHAISVVVKVASITKCPFAVKSGGHAAFAGGSSVQDGILVNLARLNSVVLSQDRKTAHIGAGQRWYDVYLKLDPLNVSVVGGRDGGVGVGGLVLGGGISYFSGRYGYGCDNVRNYEVVLANGQIVNASPTTNADLYWALRGGGGSNFGIVTRFDLAAFEQGLLWGGSKFHSIQTSDALAQVLANFNDAAPTDPFAHLYIAFLYAAQLGGFAATSGPVYGKPTPNPPIFDELNAVPSIFEATSVANMSRLAAELRQTSTQRQLFRTVTFKNSASLIKGIVKIWQEEVNLLLDVSGLFPALAFQPISKNILQQMQKNGGNAFGLTPDRGPLMIMNMQFGWSVATDDARVDAAVARVVTRAVALGKKLRLNDPFIYMNYASLDQPVFEGYGRDSVAKLKAIKLKYDPLNVFGRLWRGYFKL